MRGKSRFVLIAGAIVFISLMLLHSFKMKLSFSLLTLVPISFTAAAQYDGYHSGYSFDANYFHAPMWMTSLPDNTNLTSLSIPGTHDTITSAVVGPVYQCQNQDLSTQLEAGLRYFDIRARLVNDTLQIYHQDAYTEHSYTSVLATFFSFLTTNPGETILMRLKEEITPINSTIDFLTAFNHYRLNDPLTSAGCLKHFWLPSTPGPPSIPTLRELRSKILILQNFGSEPAQYGIKWESPLLSIEDDYEIPDLYLGLDSKFEAVRKGLESAANGINNGELYLSHLSASVGILPIEAAAGTRNRSVVGINDRTGKYLAGRNGNTGVVIIDFPGQALIGEILSRNSV